MTEVTILWDSAWEEFQVPSDAEGHLYHTPDIDDAVDTARAMHGKDVEMYFRSE